MPSVAVSKFSTELDGEMHPLVAETPLKISIWSGPWVASKSRRKRCAIVPHLIDLARRRTRAHHERYLHHADDLQNREHVKLNRPFWELFVRF